MNWLESILYSLITAAAELMPISAQAHRTILNNLIGVDGDPYLLRLMIHLAVLIAVLIHYRETIAKINLTNRILAISPRRRKRQPDAATVYVIRLLRTALFPLLLGFILLVYTGHWKSQLHIVSLLLVLNGIILFIPAHMPQGNKNAKNISGLNSLLIGLFSGLGAVPGLSRVGLGLSASIAQGADSQSALTWTMLLSVPSLLVMSCIDIYMMVTGGVLGFNAFMLVQYFICSVFAYISAYMSLIFMRFMSVKVGFSAFSYYCWGTAMFAFILYMI